MKFAGIEKVEDITPQFWENRMEQINNFENILLKTELL
jgi:polyphosphate kinase 2 (PPK2 family)